MRKSCVICGEEFEARCSRSKNCSSHCRILARKEYYARPEIRKRESEYKVRRHQRLMATDPDYAKRRRITARKYDASIRYKKTKRVTDLRRRQSAAYSVLAEWLGGRDNLNQFLEERNLV